MGEQGIGRDRQGVCDAPLVEGRGGAIALLPHAHCALLDVDGLGESVLCEAYELALLPDELPPMEPLALRP